MNPTISVVIPTYNRAAKVMRALDSLAIQSLKPHEVIVVDDGGSDDTKERIVGRNDLSLVYLYQDNAGPAVARQTGREAATGESVVYLDSDDTFFPSALSHIAQALMQPGKAYGLSAHRRIITLVDAEGTVLKKIDDDSGLAKTLTPDDIYAWKMKTTSSGVFHRNDKRFDHVHWRPNVLIEDWEFMLQLLNCDPDGFAYVSEPCLDYVQVYGADGMCSNASYADFGHAFGQIYEWHKNDRLLTDHSVFTDRVKKYARLQAQVDVGEIAPPQYKYFPELWQK